ncbi:hypothetical protein L7F22_049957 [Adiantum nelumboides]|nr:hypothetical protein [Adiantum nelumboides]
MSLQDVLLNGIKHVSMSKVQTRMSDSKGFSPPSLQAKHGLRSSPPFQAKGFLQHAPGHGALNLAGYVGAPMGSLNNFPKLNPIHGGSFFYAARGLPGSFNNPLFKAPVRQNLQRNADEEEKQLHIKLLALHGLDAASLLRHIVLIKDGNNRWVQWEIMLPEQGYEAGVNAWQYRNVQLSARSCVSILTAFCFSTKNRRRPQT